jgi:hypothetical protein
MAAQCATWACGPGPCFAFDASRCAAASVWSGRWAGHFPVLASKPCVRAAFPSLPSVDRSLRDVLLRTEKPQLNLTPEREARRTPATGVRRGPIVRGLLPLSGLLGPLGLPWARFSYAPPRSLTRPTASAPAASAPRLPFHLVARVFGSGFSITGSECAHMCHSAVSQPSVVALLRSRVPHTVAAFKHGDEAGTDACFAHHRGCECEIGRRTVETDLVILQTGMAQYTDLRSRASLSEWPARPCFPSKRRKKGMQHLNAPLVAIRPIKPGREEH